MNINERLRTYGKVVLSGDQLRKVEEIKIEPKIYYDFTYATSSAANKLKKIATNKIVYKGLGYVDEDGKPVIFNREDTLIIIDGSLQYLNNYEITTLLNLINYGVKVKLYYASDEVKLHLSIINFDEIINVDDAPEINRKKQKNEEIKQINEVKTDSEGIKDEVIFEQINSADDQAQSKKQKTKK